MDDSISKEQNESISNEAFIHNLESGVKEFFPDYSVVNKEGFFNDEEDDSLQNGRGRVIEFYQDEEKRNLGPVLKIIYRTKSSDTTGFVVNYLNSPEPSTTFTIRAAGNSIYGPREKRWQTGQIDLALENAKIQMNGIDQNSPEFQNQISGWSAQDNRFLTMQERINIRAELISKTKKTDREIVEFSESIKTVWDLYFENIEKAGEIAAARLTKDQYEISNITLTKDAAIAEVKSKTPLGIKIIEREMNIIAAQERLLKNKNIL